MVPANASAVLLKKQDRYSYSALSRFIQCPYSFYQRYVAKNISHSSSLALEIGTIAHKVKELISCDLLHGIPPDYAKYQALMYNGYIGADKSTGKPETLLGCTELKIKYYEDWLCPDVKSGLSYEQKLDIFFSHLPDEENDKEWTTIASELFFELPFHDITLFGFIDNVARNSKGDLRIVDYKSSKKIYSDADIKTPLQMVIYSLVLKTLYPTAESVDCLYDFVFLGCKQQGGTKSWLDRGCKKLDKTFSAISQCRETDVWKPCPSPLCHWCDFSSSNPNAEPSLHSLCPFHSLWTPANKTYASAQKWQDGTKASDLAVNAEQNNPFIF